MSLIKCIQLALLESLFVHRKTIVHFLLFSWDQIQSKSFSLLNKKCHSRLESFKILDKVKSLSETFLDVHLMLVLKERVGDFRLGDDSLSVSSVNPVLKTIWKMKDDCVVV